MKVHKGTCWQRLQFLVTGLDVARDSANALLDNSDTLLDFVAAPHLLFLALVHRDGD